MTAIERYLSGDRIWTCAVCGNVGPWSRGWQRWGSITADEDCGHDVPTCSTECRNDPRLPHLIATYDRAHLLGSCKGGAA